MNSLTCKNCNNTMNKSEIREYIIYLTENQLTKWKLRNICSKCNLIHLFDDYIFDAKIKLILHNLSIEYQFPIDDCFRFIKIVLLSINLVKLRLKYEKYNDEIVIIRVFYLYCVNHQIYISFNKLLQTFGKKNHHIQLLNEFIKLYHEEISNNVFSLVKIF